MLLNRTVSIYIDFQVWRLYYTKLQNYKQQFSNIKGVDRDVQSKDILLTLIFRKLQFQIHIRLYTGFQLFLLESFEEHIDQE